MDSEERDPVIPVLSETVAYKRYLHVLHRDVVLPPDGRTVSFDVAGTSDFVVVLPFHTADSTITLIREYGQGPNQLVYALAGGCYEPHKTPTRLDCAQAELSEEARLCGGTWENLLPEGHPGIVELKWVRNRFWPFLCVDPEVDAQPGARDADEYINVVRLPTRKVHELVLAGEVMLASVQALVMGIDLLKSRGLHVDGW